MGLTDSPVFWTLMKSPGLAREPTKNSVPMVFLTGAGVAAAGAAASSPKLGAATTRASAVMAAANQDFEALGKGISRVQLKSSA